MISVLLWFGVIGAVREWRYAKKLGAPLARTEKWYLAGGLVLAFAVSMIGDLMGLFGDLMALSQTRTTFTFWVAVVLIVWTARQMVRRTRSRESLKTVGFLPSINHRKIDNQQRINNQRSRIINRIQSPAP